MHALTWLLPSCSDRTLLRIVQPDNKSSLQSCDMQPTTTHSHMPHHNAQGFYTLPFMSGHVMLSCMKIVLVVYASNVDRWKNTSGQLPYSCFSACDVLTFCDDMAQKIMDVVIYTCRTLLTMMFVCMYVPCVKI